jgi:hypothetical protein
MPRQTPGAADQAPVRPALVPQLDGDGGRRPCRLHGDVLMETALREHRLRLRIAPLPEELMPLRPGEQRQLEGGHPRRGDRRGEQILEMPGQAVDGRTVEQIGGVLDRTEQPAVALLESEREIELRRRSGSAHRAQAQILDLQSLDRSVLQNQRHLEQGCVREASFRRELLDELFERHLLMCMGGQRGLADPAEQLGERGRTCKVAAQHQGADEEPDQTLDLHPVASVDRSAHGEIALSAVARQESLETGQQGHEERRSLAPAQSLHLSCEGGRQPHGPRGAAEALHRRPGAVGGEIEPWRQARELPAPEGDLALQNVAVQPGALPGCEIRVLHRQLRQGRGPALGERRVESPDLADQDAHRPAIAHDVVHGHRGDMVLLSQPDQQAAQQRPAREMEWADRFLCSQGAGGCLAPGLRQPRHVDQRQPEGGGRLNDLHRRAIRGREDGAQRLVAARDLTEAERQNPGVQRPLDAQRHRDVVERAVRLEAIDEPETLLRKRQGKGLSLAVGVRDDHGLRGRCRPLVAESDGPLPGRRAQGILARLAPPVAHTRLDRLVLEELHVSQHPALRVDAVRHPLPLLLVGVRHGGMEVDSQSSADPPQLGFGVAHQVFEKDLELPLGRHAGEEIRDVLVAHEPDQLRQLGPAERMRMAEEELVELGVLERADHGVGVANEMDVERPVERLLRPPQDRRVQRVGRCLVHQGPVAQPALELAVEALRRPALLHGGAEGLPRRFEVAGVGLHGGADRPFEPEAVAARERGLAVGHGVEGEQLQLRRREEQRVAAEQDAQERRARARRRKDEDRRRVLPGRHAGNDCQWRDESAERGHPRCVDAAGRDIRLAARLVTERCGAPEAENRLRVLADQIGRHLRHGGGVEEDDDVHDPADLPLQPVDQDHAADRVAAEIEEGVVEAHALDPERAAPEAREERLERRPRRCVALPAAVLLRSRERLAIHLAVRIERQGREHHDGGRHHVVRQPLSQRLQQRAGCLFVGRPFVEITGDIGHQAPLAVPPVGSIFARHHDRLADSGERQQHGLDLSQLDAKAPDLDLVILSPQVLHIAIGEEAPEVPRPVEPRSGAAAGRVRNEPLCRQVRPAQIAARQPGATDRELARHADGHRPQARVHHRQ